MTILITNDDGIHSEGILALKTALKTVGKVLVVAPDRPRSASGHSITLHKPLRVHRVRMADGEYGFASNGTPSDCVSLGVLDLAESKVDLVVSGINHGPNLGWDLTYSGTVSAAMEGAVMGIQSFAVSVAAFDHPRYEYAASFSAHLARILFENKLPESVLLNVNVPAAPPEEIKEIEITKQGKRHYGGKLDKRVDPAGRAYYWLGGEPPTDEAGDGTDVKAIAEGRVSVTPVHLDLTGYSVLEQVEKWGVKAFYYFAGHSQQNG